MDLTLKHLKELSVKDIYILIRNFDFEVGECFIDYNESFVQNTNLVFYLLGRGIINTIQLNDLIDKQLIKICDLNEILYECGIIRDNDKRLILAELTQNFDTLLKRLYNAYEEYHLCFTVNQDFKDLIGKEFDILKGVIE